MFIIYCIVFISVKCNTKKFSKTTKLLETIDITDLQISFQELYLIVLIIQHILH